MAQTVPTERNNFNGWKSFFYAEDVPNGTYASTFLLLYFPVSLK